jgi:nicotinate-nucleotide adenylyltransferase
VSSTAGPRRIGVLGGTFDPIHLGHLVAASEALHQLELDQVVFVPAGRPWQKSVYSDGEDRFLMTTLGVMGHARFSTSRVELDRRGPTYTVDTLSTMRDFWGEETKLFFITGGDTLAGLSTWHEVHKLAGVAELVAVTRPGSDVGSIAREDTWPNIHVLDIPLLAVSGTDVRRRVASGRPIDFLVPPEVVSYIRDHGLYVEAASA